MKWKAAEVSSVLQRFPYRTCSCRFWQIWNNEPPFADLTTRWDNPACPVHHPASPIARLRRFHRKVNN